MGFLGFLYRCLVFRHFFSLSSRNGWQLFIRQKSNSWSRRTLNLSIVNDLLQQLRSLLLRCRSYYRASALDYVTVFVSQLLGNLLRHIFRCYFWLLGLTYSRLAVFNHSSGSLAYGRRKRYSRLLLSFSFQLKRLFTQCLLL